METIYSSLVRLLNETDEHPEFRIIAQTIGEEPEITGDSPRHYLFRESGIEIMTLRLEPCGAQYVFSIMFFVDIPSTRNGYIKPYSGEFIAGITTKDSLANVREKIKIEPLDLYAKHVPKLRYKLGEVNLNFYFGEPKGQKLYTVAVTSACLGLE